MRLSRDTIIQIVRAYDQGEERPAIAQRFNVDGSTVTYHIERFEEKYGTTSAVYSLIPAKPKVCTHPSLKCLVCGKAQDHIHRRELEEIASLQTRLNRANEIIQREGWGAV